MALRDFTEGERVRFRRWAEEDADHEVKLMFPPGSPWREVKNARDEIVARRFRQYVGEPTP